MILAFKGYVNKITERADAIFGRWNLDETRVELEETEMRLCEPDVWDKNPDAAVALSSKRSELSGMLADYNKIMSNITKMTELADERPDFIEDAECLMLVDKEFTKLHDESDKILTGYEEALVYRAEEDSLPCIMKITAGAGGTEACDWCTMLFGMYTSWCVRNGFSISLQNIQKHEDNLIKTVTLKIEQSSGGKFPYGILKGETGVHRLVRISPYNAQGKRMTSFCSVFCCPEVDDTIDVTLDPAKLEFDYFRSGGAGGQNVNKVSSGVRARYVYTDPDTGETEEILVENTETRDQPKNKENAIRNLKSILYRKELDRRRKISDALEESKGDNGWGNQIRSYVLDNHYVKDLRTGVIHGNPDKVLAGDINVFLKAEAGL